MSKLGTPIGIIIALGLVIFGIGLDSIGLFIDAPSFMIVVGGSVGAGIMIFGLGGMKSAITAMKIAFTRSDADRVEELLQVQKLARKARKNGILSLEDDYRNCDNDFMKIGLQHIIDGTEPEIIKTLLDTEIDNTYSRHETCQNILAFLGEAMPAFGMIVRHVAI